MNWFTFTIFFSSLVFIWEIYLNFRQRSKLFEPNIPKLLHGIIDLETFTKSRMYGLDKSLYSLIHSCWNQFETFLVLYYGGLPFAWYMAGNVLSYFGYTGYEITQSVLFGCILYLYSQITSLPWNMYFTFVLEEKHGFNKETIKIFISDLLKSTILAAVIGIPLLSLFLLIIRWGGDQFYLYVFIFMFFVQIVSIIIYPTFIAPLFNTFDPLEDGDLKDDIGELAKKLKFPLTSIYVVDGSTRTSHSNAYFFGFFKNKRIVLYDTLLKGSSNNEILSVIAHEMGHWNYNHIFTNLVIHQIYIFILFYIFGTMISNQNLYRSFGFTEMPVIIGFILFQFIYSPVDLVMTFGMNILSRKHEFQADEFAKDLGYGEDLQKALIKLSISNLGNMNPDELYSAFYYSHPPLVERLRVIAK